MSRSKILLALLLFVIVQACVAQDSPKSATDSACGLPLLSNPDNARNMFNEQQEEWLGDVLDQSVRNSLHVVTDPDDYLQKIGERLLAVLPPTGVHYQFVIVDSPGMNSFGLAGGRIYIYRRMISFARNEDELAALVGHEIGHMIMHQQATQISDWFRQAGITQVGDREDVFRKWNQFQDAVGRLKGFNARREEQREEQAQLIADRIALYALKRAGYDPTQFASFADRSFETRGNVGGFWSDLFGKTSPESKRLREILRRSGPLPPQCIAPRPDTSSFARWQHSVLVAKIEVTREQIPGLIKKISLNPPLRNDLNHLRFSPDGKYLLAQDSSGIFVLARSPFANVFRIDAPEAKKAQFTPDSSAIVFYDKELRVEKWDIAAQKQDWIHEIPARCNSTALSPTGEVMACVSPDYDLRLISVPDGEVLFLKRNVFEPTPAEAFLAEVATDLAHGNIDLQQGLFSNLAFSPDGRYFLGGHLNSAVAYDLQSHTEVKVPGKLKEVVGSSFTFLSSSEIFGLDPYRQKVLRVEFPSGKVRDEFPPIYGHFSASGSANYVMVQPAGIAPIGAIDLSAKKVTLGYKTAAFAIFGDVFAGDDADGLLKLYRLSDHSAFGHVQLPDSPLTAARVSAFSDDGEWVAVSGPMRGGLWNVQTGQKAGFSTQFDGAFFNKETLIARFPGDSRIPARILAVTPDPLSVTKLYDLGGSNGPASDLPFALRTSAWQLDDLLFRFEPSADKKSPGYILDVRDVLSNTSLWHLPIGYQHPHFFYSKSGNTIVFVKTGSEQIKKAGEHDPALQARLRAINREDKESLYLLEICNSRSHQKLGNILVNSGNPQFRITGAVATGDRVFVMDSKKRTLVYSLKSGEKIGEVFGNAAAVSASGERVLIEDGRGVMDLYDTRTMKSLKHFTFPSRIVEASFLKDDKVLVLTSDESVYELGLSSQDAGSVAKQPATP